jgi:hypothetical protein
MATDAEKVKMYREKAKDTSVPQEVRNTYLDRANELERKAFEDTKKAPTPPTKMAKGGMPVRGSRTATNKEKKMMGGGYAMPEKKPMMAKGGAVKKPVVAIMIGVGKPKKMATGGMPMVEKGGMKVPAFAADGKGKMAKGGVVKKPMAKKGK